ncbi:response regulator [Paenibacillus albicereus]|uniref:Transcriptional regulatory protein n=1 Tax=Paenibacillus albicereus TaxID=2726185 RepID=A0A6H2H326_9BACL|nr:response regulator [Paenibacillus albicereus]QJC54035.1 response regulator [Paenibacillus albicereus]
MIQVLIVEDDVRNAEIHRRFVGKVEGFEAAGVATDGRQALELLDILQPDLVLLDLFLPHVDGLELLRRIRAEHPRAGVIMVTAAKELHRVREAIEGGVYDYLLKPVIFDRLQEALLGFRSYRERMATLEAAGALGQPEIDALLRLREPVAERGRQSAYPKGIDQLTLDKVSGLLAEEEGPLTAPLLSARLGISRSTARRYLEYLVSAGRLQADLAYGSVGRPERVYRRKA